MKQEKIWYWDQNKREKKNNSKRTVFVFVRMKTNIRNWNLKTSFYHTVLKGYTTKAEMLRLCVSQEQLG